MTRPCAHTKISQRKEKREENGQSLPDHPSVRRLGVPHNWVKDNKEIHSVVHAIRLLELFEQGEGLSVTEISRRLEIPRASIYRLLNTLLAHEWIFLGTDKKYHMTLRLLDIGRSALSVPTLQQIVTPFLLSLVSKTKETVHFAVLDGERVGYVAKEESPHPIRMFSHIGWRGPLHATAAGKVLLAYADSLLIDDILSRELQSFTANTKTSPSAVKEELQHIRTVGFATDNEELIEGLLCVAVPVMANSSVFGALSLSGPKDRMARHPAAEIAVLMQEESRRIEARVAHSELSSK